jgi:putative SOS response-associated peptidase YedK
MPVNRRPNFARRHTRTIIVTEPNTIAAEVHDRMPVVLERESFGSWLNDSGIE